MASATVPDLSQTKKRVRRRHDYQPQTFAETLSRLADRKRQRIVPVVDKGHGETRTEMGDAGEFPTLRPAVRGMEEIIEHEDSKGSLSVLLFLLHRVSLAPNQKLLGIPFPRLESTASFSATSANDRAG